MEIDKRKPTHLHLSRKQHPFFSFFLFPGNKKLILPTLNMDIKHYMCICLDSIYVPKNNGKEYDCGIFKVKADFSRIHKEYYSIDIHL